MKTMKRITILLAGAATVSAVDAAWAGNDGVYELGQINVTAAPEQGSEFGAFGGSTISNAQTERFNKGSLDKAIDLVPGVSAATTGTQRNETNIYVHGFDRLQVPLSIDGVRIYLPADNRLDFSRFLTDDISQIQIAKGYVSVLDGPGGLGGAINLVTKKPVKAFEGEWRSQAEFGNDGAFDGFKNYGRVGSKQDNYYFQASAAWRKLEGWELPSSFSPTAIENGGRRDYSASNDWSVNLKAGWTPNPEDEYSINFIRQNGKKDAPYNVEPTASPKYWSWPYWNVQILSAATKTAVGDDAYVKTRTFWETFDNAIDMWDDPAQTQRYSSSAARSIYQDWAVGNSIEIGKDFGTLDTLKLATHIRRDNHSEWNETFTDQYGLNATTTPKSATCSTSKASSHSCFVEPTQVSTEDTYSVGSENTVHITRDFDWVQGIGYDWRHLSKAEDYSLGQYKSPVYYAPYWINYRLTDDSAFNWQTAAIWRYSDTAKLFLNISDRTRFPTLSERFSSKFGTAASNPELAPERAVNYQIGWTNAFAPNSQVSVLGYYATVTDMIQSVATGKSYTDPISKKVSAITQNQNVGDGYRYGVDFAVDYAVNATLMLGGNVSYIHNQLTNPSDPTVQQTGIPTVKGMLYASYSPIESVTLTPSLQYADERWSQKNQVIANKSVNSYVKTGAYLSANFAAEYRMRDNLTWSGGVKNIFDQYYALAWGYPEAGRTFYVGMKATF
ncbi:TonB-dependent receptor [Rhodopseudomonas palustris]|uniref:TonB-dependent receptor n=1 Tax=Rhodopseudomonas palustris (strain BisB18) TaxID=316056 RepID=Q216Z6_RHOPB